MTEHSALSKPDAPELPPTFKRLVQRHPEVAEAHEAMWNAVEAAGPLDRRTMELIKIGIAAGAGLETAARSHARRARAAGASPEEVEQAVLLAINTVGFPRAMIAWSALTEQPG